jgi:hypothetical protein
VKQRLSLIVRVEILKFIFRVQKGVRIVMEDMSGGMASSVLVVVAD